MSRRIPLDPKAPSCAAHSGGRAARLLAALILAVGLGMVLIGPAQAADQDAGPTAGPAGQDDAEPDAEPAEIETVVTVIEVSGLVDPIIRSFIAGELAEAADRGDAALVLQLNSEGSVIGADIDQLVRDLGQAPLTVAVWVGPPGSKAHGGAAELLAGADVVGIAPGSTVDVPRRGRPAFDPGEAASVGERLGSEQAERVGLADNSAPTLAEFVDTLPGVGSDVVETDDGPRRQLAATARVRLTGLGLVDQLFHTVASPAVAYLLVTIGGGLLIFELYTAGVGVAGMVGAGSLLLGAYGLGVLPVRPLGLALGLLAFVGFAIDVQTGVPRAWTVIASAAFVAATFLLFDGPEPSWIARLAGITGIILCMAGGMPTMVRTRFSTPTIGRHWMIGEAGTAVADLAPEGVVRVRDAPWRARTNRATPIAEGDSVVVVDIDGLVLEVEPARDS